MVTGAAPRAVPRLSVQLSTQEVELVDGAEVVDADIVGDLSAQVASHIFLTGCRLDRVQLTGATLLRAG